MFKKKYRLVCITNNLEWKGSHLHKKYAIEYKRWWYCSWFVYRTYESHQLDYAERYFKLLTTNKLKETEVIC